MAAVRFRRWPRKVELKGGVLSMGCLRLCSRCFTDSGVESEDFRCQNGAEKVPKAKQMEPTGCQGEPRDVTKHSLGSSVETAGKKEGRAH